MKNQTVTINYKGKILTVIGRYCPAEMETRIDPGCDSLFDIYEIYACNSTDDESYEISDLISDEHFDEIAILATSEYEDN